MELKNPCPACRADPRMICFKHKLGTLQFGAGTQNEGARKNYFDREALESQIGDLDANAAYTREATEGYGALRWSKGEPYFKDRDTGDYNRLSAGDMERVMYGSRRSAETSRSFSVGARKTTGASGG